MEGKGWTNPSCAVHDPVPVDWGTSFGDIGWHDVAVVSCSWRLVCCLKEGRAEG
jgi:hypothetical protein